MLKRGMPLFVDTHVHYYPSYKLEIFLDHAYANFIRLGSTASDQNLLCLTERYDCNFFEEWKSILPSAGKWQLAPMPDDTFLLARSPQGAILIASGSQMVTKERLEVLSLCCRTKVSDRISLMETLAQVHANGGVISLPWAPGKWLGKRGALMAHVVASAAPGSLALADSSLRPRWVPAPALFRYAEHHQISVLCGSDPLPFAAEVTRAGQYVSWHEESLLPASLSESLKNILLTKLVRSKSRGTRSSIAEVAARLYQLRKNR